MRSLSALSGKRRKKPLAEGSAAKVATVLARINKAGKKNKIQLKTFNRVPEKLSKDRAFRTGFQAMDDLLSGQLDDKARVVVGSGYGVPRGRVIEIYGGESSGKTTLALQIIAATQKAGGAAGFVDAEHTFDPHYAGILGVDNENLIFDQPDSGEDAAEKIKLMARAGVDIIVVDSVAAMDPEAEQEKAAGKTVVGAQARLLSQLCRQLAGICGKSGATVIFLNQIRMRIVMFGDPKTTSGGNALKFYSSIRLELKKVKNLVKEGRSVGGLHSCKSIKNKVVPAQREVILKMRVGHGIVDVLTSLKEAA